MHIRGGLHSNLYCMDSCMYILISVKEMNHYTTNPTVGGKHQRKERCEWNRRRVKSHCYNRLKIDQISAFSKALSASLKPLSVRCHKFGHIRRLKVTTASWYLLLLCSENLDFTLTAFRLELHNLLYHVFLSLFFLEYGASRCFLSQSPWHESLRVCVLFA